MKKTRVQVKSDSKRQKVASWVSSNRLVLILASLLVPLAYVFVSLTTEGAKSNNIVLLLSAFLVLACGVLTITVAQIIALLRAIRGELIMIRTRIDRERLDDIAGNLTAIRDQMGKGVLGLLGI